MLFKVDKDLKVIHYSLARDVAPDEELSTYYGPHAKFSEEEESEEETLDGWDAISSVAGGLCEESTSSIGTSCSKSKLATEQGASPIEVDPVHILYRDLPCLKVSNHVSLADLPLQTGESTLNIVGEASY